MVHAVLVLPHLKVQSLPSFIIHVLTILPDGDPPVKVAQGAAKTSKVSEPVGEGSVSEYFMFIC